MPDIKVDPGPGYRLLEVGEIRPEGYETLNPDTNTCVLGEFVGSTVSAFNTSSLRVKLPEPTAPKSLSLEEILDEVEAKPSDDSADVLRYEASFFKHGESGARGWTAQADASTALLKHDGHYRTLEAKGAEPIEHMEAIVCRGIPEDLHRIAKRNLNMAMASKHQDRAGEKSGEAWEKELQKAENYLHRAWSGRWI